jgi:hypothetical protein
MKHKAFIVSWFYKSFTLSNILAIIIHICTCDDVTLVNEKSIVSWKYLESNKKCVFDDSFQYLSKHVPTTYFSMIFNIHKHLFHLNLFLVPVCGQYEIHNWIEIEIDLLTSSKIKLVVLVVLLQEKYLKKNYVKVLMLNRKKCTFWRWFTTDLIVHRLVYFNFIPTKKNRKKQNKTNNQKEKSRTKMYCTLDYLRN